MDSCSRPFPRRPGWPTCGQQPSSSQGPCTLYLPKAALRHGCTRPPSLVLLCSGVGGRGSGNMGVCEQLAQRLGSALLTGHMRLWRSWQGHDWSSDLLVECPSWELILRRVRSMHPGPGFWRCHVVQSIPEQRTFLQTVGSPGPHCLGQADYHPVPGWSQAPGLAPGVRGRDWVSRGVGAKALGRQIWPSDPPGENSHSRAQGLFGN